MPTVYIEYKNDFYHETFTDCIWVDVGRTDQNFVTIKEDKNSIVRIAKSEIKKMRITGNNANL